MASKKTNDKDLREQMSQLIVRSVEQKDEVLESKKHALTFEQAQKFKELLLQNVKKSSGKTFAQYTKALILQYLRNPYSNRDSIREVSRYLWRASTLYKKIILYYATMPLYNYNVVQKVDFVNGLDMSRLMADYEKILKRLQGLNIQNEFSTAMTVAIRDGVYFGYVYDNKKDGMFFHMLDPQYCKIRGKNEYGQWVIAFDATYFARGNNRIFVEGIDGDTSSCFDQVFIDGWNAYLKDSQNYRWFLLPPEKTITLLANEDSEFDFPLPFYTGLLPSVLDLLDFEQIIADKTVLENYYLLLLKIPLVPNSDVIDDFGISLDVAEAFKSALEEIVPSLVGVGMLPGMDTDTVSFSKSNTVDDTDTLSKAINNVFSNAGAAQMVVSTTPNSNSTAIRLSIANDASLTFTWISRLESNFNYYIYSNVSKNYMFKILRETWYNRDDFVDEQRQACALGAPKMPFLCAMGNTPYEALCMLKFESALGIVDMMEPLKSSYNTASSEVGRPKSSESDLSDEGVATRDGDKHDN